MVPLWILFILTEDLWSDHIIPTLALRGTVLILILGLLILCLVPCLRGFRDRYIIPHSHNILMVISTYASVSLIIIGNQIFVLFPYAI